MAYLAKIHVPSSVDRDSAVTYAQKTHLKHNVSFISFMSREQGLQQLCFYIGDLYITLGISAVCPGRQTSLFAVTETFDAMLNIA